MTAATLQSTHHAAGRRPLAELVDRERARGRRRCALLVGALILAVALIAALVVVLRPRPVPLAARFRAQLVTAGDVIREVRATSASRASPSRSR
jgi:hypothetical protein